MNPRYRCPFCGSFATAISREAQDHMIKTHRRALTWLLRPLSVFRDVVDPEEI